MINGSNDSLTNYAGGIYKKVRLLSLVKADIDMSMLFIPKKALHCKKALIFG